MLELRLLNDDDIPLAEMWLNKEHVKKWYEIPHLDVSINDWIYELKERGGEFNWLTHLIVLHHGRPIGYCQYYKCEDSGEEDFGSLPIAGSYGIDYLIGEEACLGKGLGKEMITLLTNKIFSFPDAQRITADIDKENKASEGALLSCGFTLFDAESSRYVLFKPEEKRPETN
ncbi:GNAT family N-acetyltransferase [Clostridium sp. MCC353]|uniref:GNAT family N-acetyltransferase n=1 Tax=Clostridium sp. MCC353 TaxID=2592646 RepID=UPI001C023E82|nr:GNAT family N-acetyltransferase [Clostridium sp. MCC353]MBT9779442.1 GNAT family N-acetyltransferase [Clostridium sp. MCC353]